LLFHIGILSGTAKSSTIALYSFLSRETNRLGVTTIPALKRNALRIRLINYEPKKRVRIMDKLIDFLNELESRKIYYKLAKHCDEYVMVEIDVPGERWEVEFSPNDVRIEKFKSDGTIYDEKEITTLFKDFSD